MPKYDCQFLYDKWMRSFNQFVVWETLIIEQKVSFGCELCPSDREIKQLHGEMGGCEE